MTDAARKIQDAEQPVTALDRSLLAFRNASPEQDAYTVGAAEFFGVVYDDVTPQQRAAWKWATKHVRYASPPPSPTPNAKHSMRRKLI